MRYPLQLLTAIAICLLSVGVATAQDDGAGTEQLMNEGDFSLVNENLDDLSNDQMVSRASNKIKNMRQTLSRTNEMLDTVKDQERDVLKVNCINEKHATMKGFVKVSEQAYIGLEAAAKKGDRSEATHNYKLVSLGQQRVKGLSQEASLCTGEERRLAGKGEMDVVQPTNGKEEVDGYDGSDILTEDLPELTPYQ